MTFTSIKGRVTRFLRDDAGLAAVEYAVMAVIVVGVIVAARVPLQSAIDTAFGDVKTAVEGVVK
ncbi:MAG: Flp family type IVb pilin [Caulobacter sp.]